MRQVFVRTDIFPLNNQSQSRQKLFNFINMEENHVEIIKNMKKENVVILYHNLKNAQLEILLWVFLYNDKNGKIAKVHAESKDFENDRVLVFQGQNVQVVKEKVNRQKNANRSVLQVR